MENLVFAASAVIVLTGALGVIFAKNPVHSALMLVMTLFGVAVLFVSEEAHFLAAVQVIVYAGAIVVLFLFVIMLLGVDREEMLETKDLKGQRPLAIALGLVTLAELLLLSRGTHWATGGSPAAGSPQALDGVGSNVEKLADAIFTRYLSAFEITSVLLVIAVVGAVVLARRAPQRVGSNEEASTP
jgi:NADH-quinone oxidoreductase subunit J